MDADFCRALSAAVLGDPGKVEFMPPATSARFPSLKAGEIDVLVRNTTWTLEREATLIGASANVVSAGISAAHGRPISFGTFARYGIPLTLCQLILSAGYVLFLRWMIGQ